MGRGVLLRGNVGYAAHLRLIGKPIGDFLFVLIELFRLVLRLKRYERISMNIDSLNIVRQRAILKLSVFLCSGKIVHIIIIIFTASVNGEWRRRLQCVVQNSGHIELVTPSRRGYPNPPNFGPPPNIHRKKRGRRKRRRILQSRSTAKKSG